MSTNEWNENLHCDCKEQFVHWDEVKLSWQLALLDELTSPSKWSEWCCNWNYSAFGLNIILFPFLDENFDCKKDVGSEIRVVFA